MTFYGQPRRPIGETLLTLAFGLVIAALALQAMLTVAAHWLAVLAPFLLLALAIGVSATWWLRRRQW